MEFRYRYGGDEYTIHMEPQEDGSYAAVIGDRSYRVEVQRAHHGQLNFLVDGKRSHAYTASCEVCQTGMHLRYVALVDRQASLYELARLTGTARPRRPEDTEGGDLTAQMPGQVMEVLVTEGQHVERGQTLLLLEAMKMEMRVQAPRDGVVSQLLVGVGDTVERGQQLAVVAENARER